MMTIGDPDDMAGSAEGPGEFIPGDTGTDIAMGRGSLPALTSADGRLLKEPLVGDRREARALTRSAQFLAVVGQLPLVCVAVLSGWMALQFPAVSGIARGAVLSLVAGSLWGVVHVSVLARGRHGGRRHEIAGTLVGTGLIVAAAGLLLPGLFMAGMGSSALWISLRVIAVDAIHPDLRARAIRSLAAGSGVAAVIVIGLAVVVRGFDRTPSLVFGLCGVLAMFLTRAAMRRAPWNFEDEDWTQLAERDRSRSASDGVRDVLAILRRTRSGKLLLGAATSLMASTYLFVASVPTVARDRWEAAPDALAFWSALAFVVAAAVARGGETPHTTAGAELVERGSARGNMVVAAGVAVIAGAFWHDLTGLALVAIGIGVVMASWPWLDFALSVTLAPRRRVPATLVVLGSGLTATLLGQLTGQLLNSRVHPSMALALAGAFAVLTGTRLREMSLHVVPDAQRMIDRVMASAALTRHIDAGGSATLLHCRAVEFAYGQVQILHGIDLTVRQGEIVALLGTNGAGKSTLLRVISGLGIPFGGTVLLDGEDITSLDPVSRVRKGVVQVPGGKASFGDMTVEENVRCHAFGLSTRKAEVDAAVEEALQVFPRLLERRDQLASTLSGGERQMLALTKALLLKPKLLLIDELSLGLAPAIVGELLDIVREINANGTAIVLVEQSVNVALSVADRAYYLVHGEVKFGGPAQELLEQPELLRSVFLSGAVDRLAGEEVDA